MNKPAATVDRTTRWYLWEGGFLAVGQAGGEVPPHAHHAIQIFLALDRPAAIRATGGEWREGRGIIVRPDVEHSFDGRGASGAMLFVDPESGEGAWLQSVLAEDITLAPEARLQGCLAELSAFRERPVESMEVGDLVRHCVRAFCAGAPPTRRLDSRVTRVLGRIRGRIRISACGALRTYPRRRACTCPPGASRTSSRTSSGCRSGATCSGAS